MSLSKEDKALIAAYLRKQLDEESEAAFKLRLIEEPELEKAMLLEAAMIQSIREQEKVLFENDFEEAETDILLATVIGAVEKQQFENLFNEAWETSDKPVPSPSRKVRKLAAVFGSFAASLLLLIWGIGFLNSPKQVASENIKFTPNESQKMDTNTNGWYDQEAKNLANNDTITTIKQHHFSQPDRTSALEQSLEPLDQIGEEFSTISLGTCSGESVHNVMRCAGLLDKDVHIHLSSEVDWNSATHERQFSIKTRDEQGNFISLSLEPIPNDYDNIPTKFTTPTKAQYRIKQFYLGITTYHYLKDLQINEEGCVAVININPTVNRLDWLIFDS